MGGIRPASTRHPLDHPRGTRRSSWACTGRAPSPQLRHGLGLDGFRVDGEEGTLVAGRRLGDRLALEYAYALADRLGTLLLRLRPNECAVVEAANGSAKAVDVVYSVRRE